MNTVKIATPGGPDDRPVRLSSGSRASCFRSSCSCCVVCRGLTCCKARRRPLDLSPVSCTVQGLKSSQIGLQRV
nr:MAG TPA: hypothetical protein [Caudoviricetes sp.]